MHMNYSDNHSSKVFRVPLFWLPVVVVLLFWPATFTSAMPVEFDQSRNFVLARILSRKLPGLHYSHKPLDDTLSREAFKLFLGSIDPRKEFLLASDVEQLHVHSTQIDDELKSGSPVLPDMAARLRNNRVKEVDSFVDEMISGTINFYKKEFLEFDPDKISYSKSVAELRDRWRRILKMRIIGSYLDLAREEQKKKKDKSQVLNMKLWHQAEAKEKKRIHRLLERLLEEGRQEFYDRYFDSVAKAYDPHSSYMSPRSKEDFDIHMGGSLEGIGAVLQEDDGNIKVVRIISGGAAEREGSLEAEDIIEMVAGPGKEPVDLVGMRIRDAVNYIRGPKGTTVRLFVKKLDGSQKVIGIVRDVILLEDTYAKSTSFKSNGKTLGYLKIPSFYNDFSGRGSRRSVSKDVRDQVLELRERGIDGLIVDLRNNGGGSLSDVVEIAGFFIRTGPVVQIKSSFNGVSQLRDDDPAILYDGPMIVLQNKTSASASEILAAALQDYDRALIMGGPGTHGKGTVQTVFDMNNQLPFYRRGKFGDLGAITVTTQKFYRITGDSTQIKGVTPDVILPDRLAYLESGEQYYDNALKWDRVATAGHEDWSGAFFNLGAAKRLIAEHAGQNEKLMKIEEDAREAGRLSRETNLPIDLASIIARREKTEADRLERKEKKKKSDEKKPSLKEQAADDPYVQEAVLLFNKLPKPPRIGWSRKN